MADPVLDREQQQTEEEREHRRMMSERMRALLAGDESSAESKPVGAYEYPTLRSEHVPAYQNAAYATTEYHPPVVPTSPDAPSAARRLADYVAVTPGMQGLHRFGDEPAGGRVKDYAPVEPAPAEPAPAQKKDLFGNLLLKNGRLIDTSAPAAPTMTVEAPVYEPVRETPSYAPQYETAPAFKPSVAPETASYDEDDSKPTPRTMSHQNVAEQKNEGLLAALSLRTKLVLAAVAAVIAILLAVVCINTAIINSINGEVSEREEHLTRLTDQLDGINGEIDQLTDPQNVETWAIQHGMSR